MPYILTCSKKIFERAPSVAASVISVRTEKTFVNLLFLESSDILLSYDIQHLHVCTCYCKHGFKKNDRHFRPPVTDPHVCTKYIDCRVMTLIMMLKCTETWVEVVKTRMTSRARSNHGRNSSMFRTTTSYFVRKTIKEINKCLRFCWNFMMVHVQYHPTNTSFGNYSIAKLLNYNL